MRDERLYLEDIVEAADAISQFLAGVPQQQFIGSDLIRSAVLQKLLVIGEAAARISADFKSRYHDIEWADVVAFRNIAIHAYFAVDWSIVWMAATVDAQALRMQVARVLEEEFPNNNSDN